jgi:hypothetical protein
MDSNRWTRHARFGALMVLLATPACDLNEVLEVPDPDVVTLPIVLDPANLPAVRAGAIREFARAYGGNQNNDGGQILYSGLLADELFNSDNFSSRQEIDARRTTQSNSQNENAFFWLQRARTHAEIGASLFAANDEQAGSVSHEELLNLAGFTYIMFAENYCGAVPFSDQPLDGTPVFGAPETTQQILERAVARFDAALALSASQTQDYIARIGRGRALLDLGRYADAAAAVSGVPTDFVHRVNYSDAVFDAGNAVWQLINAEKRWSAAGSEGTNGLPFLTNGDPRTPTRFSGPGFEGSVNHYAELKYEEAGTPIPLATGVEARLIEAEAALQANSRSQFFAVHNSLRATISLPALSDTGQTTAQLVDLHFRERGYWLWLTSHRLGDLRRLIRQYGRNQVTVFPIGPTEQGEPRGTDVTLPVPFNETNNPSYDASACHADVA